jgi:hypothetical protein
VVDKLPPACWLRSRSSPAARIGRQPDQSCRKLSSQQARLFKISLFASSPLALPLCLHNQACTRSNNPPFPTATNVCRTDLIQKYQKHSYNSTRPSPHVKALFSSPKSKSVRGCTAMQYIGFVTMDSCIFMKTTQLSSRVMFRTAEML